MDGASSATLTMLASGSSGNAALVRAGDFGLLSDLDLLALEFNHDESMQMESGRPRDLIDRILGPHGHLSNRQAGALLQAILNCSRRVRPHTIVPLHLSRECNRSALAEAAARE